MTFLVGSGPAALDVEIRVIAQRRFTRRWSKAKPAKSSKEAGNRPLEGVWRATLLTVGTLDHALDVGHWVSLNEDAWKEGTSPILQPPATVRQREANKQEHNARNDHASKQKPLPPAPYQKRKPATILFFPPRPHMPGYPHPSRTRFGGPKPALPSHSQCQSLQKPVHN